MILRITVVYGYEAQAINFVVRLITNLKNGQTMKVPQDQVGSPTLVDDIAEASCRLVEAGPTGIFHIAEPDLMNRYQFAVKVANVFGLSTENIVVPVMTSDLGQVAPRPLKAGMKCDRLLKTLNWNLCGSVEGLECFKQTQIL